MAFAGQAAISLSLAIWVFFLSRHRRLEVQHEQGTAEHAVEVKRLESVLDILMVGNDIQMLTGIFFVSVYLPTTYQTKPRGKDH